MLPPVALLGTVLEELLAGLLLQSVSALGRRAVLQLGHVLVGLKTTQGTTDSGQERGWRPGGPRSLVSSRGTESAATCESRYLSTTSCPFSFLFSSGVTSYSACTQTQQEQIIRRRSRRNLGGSRTSAQETGGFPLEAD